MHTIRQNFKEQFSGVLSHDLLWENKAYKLKRSIAYDFYSNMKRENIKDYFSKNN